MKARRTEVASYKVSMPGAPDGEYVTVRFSTDFEKKKDAQELVTLVYENGTWRPLGYMPPS
jgi:predicted SnoaL-like aldol condensation-catalyzing enzyme